LCLERAVLSDRRQRAHPTSTSHGVSQNVYALVDRSVCAALRTTICAQHNRRDLNVCAATAAPTSSKCRTQPSSAKLGSMSSLSSRMPPFELRSNIQLQHHGVKQLSAREMRAADPGAHACIGAHDWHPGAHVCLPRQHSQPMPPIGTTAWWRCISIGSLERGLSAQTHSADLPLGASPSSLPL